MIFTKVKNFFEKARHNFHIIQSWDDYLSEIYPKFKPPSVPSADDKNHYKKYIDCLNGKGRVVILGATPHIRELFSDFEGEIFVIDYSKKAYKTMSRMLSPEISEKEVYMRIDWLEMDKFFKGNLDLVLGDLVLAQILPQLRSVFLSSVQKTLKLGGSFVARTKIYNPLWKETDTIEIIRRDFDYFSDSSVGSYITYRLGDKILDLKNQSFNTHDCLDILKKSILSAKNGGEYNYILGLIRHFSRYKQTRSHFIEKELENLLLPFFSAEDKLYASDYPESEFFPIYVLEKTDS